MNKTPAQEEDADTRALSDGELASYIKLQLLWLRRRHLHDRTWASANGLLQKALEEVGMAERTAPAGAWD